VQRETCTVVDRPIGVPFSDRYSLHPQKTSVAVRDEPSTPRTPYFFLVLYSSEPFFFGVTSFGPVLCLFAFSSFSRRLLSFGLRFCSPRFLSVRVSGTCSHLLSGVSLTFFSLFRLVHVFRFFTTLFLACCGNIWGVVSWISASPPLSVCHFLMTPIAVIPIHTPPTYVTSFACSLSPSYLVQCLFLLPINEPQHLSCV